MEMFQYSICDMHFGIVKLNRFLSKFLKELPIECFSSILPSVNSDYSAIKKDSNRIVLTVFKKLKTISEETLSRAVEKFVHLCSKAFLSIRRKTFDHF